MLFIVMSLPDNWGLVVMIEEEEEEEVLRRDDQINMAVVRAIPCCGSVASDWLIALYAFTSENCRLKPQCT
jgi:hypothetical protein